MKRFILAALCAIAAAVPALAQDESASLADLVQAGNIDAALEQIRAGADVNAPQPDGTRPLQWAIYRVQYDLVEELLAANAEVNVANAFGSTPLVEAVKLLDPRMVKLLLDAGAEPEGANQDGQTALMLAAKAENIPIAEMLIEAGADVNAIEEFHRQTPLMWAAAASDDSGEMVKLLLAHGADVTPRALYSNWGSQITSEPRAQYRPVGGLTALLYAARGGCYRCVEALLEAGADVNRPTPEGVTPLMIALDNDHDEVAKLLLDRGANPRVWDWWGRTALYIVIDRKAVATVGAADVFGNIRRSSPSPPPPGIAEVSEMEIVDQLLAAGVDPNPQLNMHRPSRGGNSGRFIDPLLNTGCTPLLRATMAGDMEVIRALVDHGADPNINGMGLTPFLYAAGVGTGARRVVNREPNWEAMELFVEHGADVNAQVTGTLTYNMRIARSPSANEGMSALHAAAQRGDTDLVRYLLEHGIDTGLLDADGRTALDLLEAAAQEGPGRAVSAAEAGPGGVDAQDRVTPEAVDEIRALIANAGTPSSRPASAR